jgi:hypothetical protein
MTLNLDGALRDLATQLREDIPLTVERGLMQMHDEAPEFFVRDDDPDFVEVYRQSYHQQLRFIYDGLESGRDLDGFEPPALAAEEARLSANLGVSLGSLLQGYRIAHRLIFEQAMERAGERIADPDLRAAVLRLTSRWLFAYIDWMTARMMEVYERERDLLVRDRERRKRQLVRDLLDDQPVDASQLRAGACARRNPRRDRAGPDHGCRHRHHHLGLARRLGDRRVGASRRAQLPPAEWHPSRHRRARAGRGRVPADAPPSVEHVSDRPRFR